MENSDCLLKEVNGRIDDDGIDSTNDGDYLCVADDTGTVHVMVIPDHLRGQTNDDLVHKHRLFLIRHILAFRVSTECKYRYVKKVEGKIT